MSKRSGIIYGILVFVVFILLILKSSGDHDSIVKLSASPGDDESMMQTRYLALWPGDYDFTLTYSAKQDTELYLYLQKKSEPYPALLSSDETSFRFPLHLDTYTDTLYFAYPASESDQFNLTSAQIHSSSLLYTDSLYEAVLFLLASLLLFLYLNSRRFRRKTKHQKLLLALMAAVVLFESIPLFRTGIHYAWDNYAHRSRLDGIMQALQNGEFPVVIYPDKCNGFGILGMVYPQLFLYIPAVFRILHVSSPVCLSTVLIFNNILAACIAFLSGMVLFRNNEDQAALFSVLFSISPYRLIDIYNRGALGEVIAISFGPLIIASLYLIITGQIQEKKKEQLSVILLTAGMTGVINSHILSIMYCTLFILFFVLINIRCFFKLKPWISLIKAALATFFINIGFLVPFLKFYFDGLSNESVEHDSFEGMAGLIDLFRIQDFSTGVIYTNLSLIGAVLLILSIIAIILTRKVSESNGDRRFMLISLVFSSVLILTAVKEFPWDFLRAHSALILKMTSVAEFRFRIMLIAVPLFLFPAVYYLFLPDIFRQRQKYLIPGIYALALISVLPGFIGEMNDTVMYGKLSGGASEDISWEYRPKGVHGEHYSNDQLFWSDENFIIDGYTKDGLRITFHYTAGQDGSYVDVPLLYYYGYGAKAIDASGKSHKLEISRGEEYRVRIHCPLEYSGSDVVFFYTGFRLIYLTAAVSTLLFLFYAVRYIIERAKEHTPV